MLTKIAIYLRAMNLYYHMCHNLVKGVVFNQDHATFLSFYDDCETDYDAVIERAITMEGEQAANITLQLKEIFNILKNKPSQGAKENKILFQSGLECEQELCRIIDACIKAGTTPGVEQLIGNIADKSEVRQYLIQQRLK